MKSLLLVLTITTLAQPIHAEDGYFDSKGVKIRYATEGKGEAVVLIHGWMGDSSMWGRDIAGNTKLKAAPGFQAIALDCRGHGKSDKPHDAAAYGTEQAEDIVRLLDHLQIKKAHLIGYSSGSFIAGHVVANHPERVISVIYGGQAPVIAGKVKDTDFSECDIFAKAVEDGKGFGPYIQAIMPNAKLTDQQANSMGKVLYGGKDVKAYALAGTTFKALAVPIEQLQKSQAPILFLHGGNESAHVKSRVAMVHQLLGRGEVKLVEGGDHMTTLAKPEFGKAIMGFLEANKTAGVPPTGGKR
jgi:pimeloyl-ACP methyl ester carboxylesterase